MAGLSKQAITRENVYNIYFTITVIKKNQVPKKNLFKNWGGACFPQFLSI